MKNSSKKLLAFIVALVAVVVLAAGYDISEWQIRPWEIIHDGLQPQGRTLWQVDRDGIENLSCRGAGSELSITDVTKLWGENVAKMTFPKGGEARVTFKEPIVIEEAADGLELWVYGPYNNGVGSGPLFSFFITDATGRKTKLPTTTGGTRWNAMRWWGVSAARLPKEIKFPIQVNGFSFSKLLTVTKDDFLCFDMLGAWNYGAKVDIPDVFQMELPFPTTDDTIMPTSTRKDGRNSLTKSDDGCVFRYEDADGVLEYAYVPQTGTLSDLQATFQTAPAFRPAKDGGPVAKVNGVSFKPGDESVVRRLASWTVDNEKATADWVWEKDGESLDVRYILSMKGKTLVAEVSSSTQGVTALDAGNADGILPGSQLFGLTYLNNRWDYPRFLATPKYLFSVFADWYTSNASYYVEGNGYGGLPAAAILSDTSARVLGGTLYSPLTDKRYVPLHDRLFFTVSDRLEEVIPNIPHPVSPYREEMIRTVCLARMYALQGRANDVDEELSFWKAMKDYGLEDMFVRYHALFRTPLENNRLGFCMDACMSNGGDEPVQRMISGLRKVVNRVGVYQDNRVISANDPYFRYDLVSVGSDGLFVPGWDGCFRPKPAAALTLFRDFLPKFTAKYDVNAEYLDELTNAPPWADVDFDANQPAAGRFAQVLRAFGAVALENRRLVNGPIWSEGCAAYLWAGLLDVDYAVSNDANANLPLIVDYKLRKMNAKATFTGADWPVLSGDDLDKFLATEIAEGNIGFLGKACAPGDEAMLLPRQGRMACLPKEYYGNVLKSYFMMRQLQEAMLSSEVEEILYEVDGEMLTASKMLMGGKTSQNRIYHRYANGLEVWVNRGEQGDWVVEAEGEEYIIPPNGHLALQFDGVMQYSIMRDGHRVDYSHGPLYTYVNGNGVKTEFPEIICAEAYLLRDQEDGSVLMTPQPAIFDETVKGLSAKSAQPLAQDRTAVGEEIRLDVTDMGHADLPVKAGVFHYLLK